MKLHLFIVASLPLFLSQTSPLSLDAALDEITLETDSDCVYYLQSGTELNDFTYTGDFIEGDGTTHRKTFTTTDPRRFFRYQEILNADLESMDTDNDGLSDAFELKSAQGANSSGISPLSSDTNGNTIPDGQEDQDGDGLTTEEEQEIGTNPLLEDTDGDTVLDGEDGWALCDKLAPKRLPKQKYAVLSLKEINLSSNVPYIEVNNNLRCIFGVGDDGYYYDGNQPNLLPSGLSYYNIDEANQYIGHGELTAYYGLGPSRITFEENSFFFNEVDGNSLKLLQDANISSLKDLSVTTYGEIQDYDLVPFFTLPSGRVFGRSVASDCSFPYIQRFLTWGNNGTTSVESAFKAVYDTFNQFTSAFESQLIKPNIFGVGIGNSLFVDHDNNLDQGAAIKDELGIINYNDFTFQTLDVSLANVLGRPFTRTNFQGSNVSISDILINNKNTVITLDRSDTKIWLDEIDPSKDLCYNREDHTSSPTYGDPLIWDEGDASDATDNGWGPAPPLNLNTKLQGWRNNGSNPPELWQNAQWHEIEIDGYKDITLHDINDHGVLAAQITKEAGTDSIGPPTPETTHAALLLPVEVVELSPKLIDKDGNDIAGSEKPNIGKPLTPFVEIDPHANRIAHRELKVKIGEALKGKKVTWAMQEVPDAIPATIRGQWEDSPTHKDRFEASSDFGANGFNRLSRASGETTIDAEGFTAVRINIPPIGFNQARIQIQIEGVSDTINLIDMEVPGVIVIDPGHGGTDSGAVGRTDNSVEEADLVLAYGLDLKTQIEKRFKEEKKNHKVIMTRDTDTFISLTARAPIARDNGADIFVSLHFNAASATTARGTETFVERTAAEASSGNPGANVNISEDEALANSLNSTTLAAVQASDAGAKNRGVKRAGKAVTRDGETRNGNIQDYHPVKACLIEVEFLSHATALNTVKLSTQSGVAIKDKFAEDAAKDIFDNIKNQQ